MPGNLHGVLARLFLRDGYFIIAVNQQILDVRFRARRIVAPHPNPQFGPCVFNRCEPRAVFVLSPDFEGAPAVGGPVQAVQEPAVIRQVVSASPCNLLQLLIVQFRVFKTWRQLCFPEKPDGNGQVLPGRKDAGRRQG